MTKVTKMIKYFYIPILFPKQHMFMWLKNVFITTCLKFSSQLCHNIVYYKWNDRLNYELKLNMTHLLFICCFIYQPDIEFSITPAYDDA